MHRRWQPDTLAKAVKGQTPTERSDKRTTTKKPGLWRALQSARDVDSRIDPAPRSLLRLAGPLPAALLLTRFPMRRSALLSGIPVLIACSGSLVWRLSNGARS
jgi:hypothetical protein